jgi:hypothetical protein
MDRQRPRPSVWSRPWLTLWAAALLAACQGFPQQFSLSDKSPDAVPVWRVVERLGEARYLAPSMAGWEQVVAGGIIPAGSQISTGIGGRLIVGQAANQLSAGTSSRFILPGLEAGGSLQQTAGWLRYRIAGDAATTFVIKTPFLDLLVGDAVLDVTVAERETEVAVVSGRVRVKSLDGRRQIDLHAGYTGYAGLQGNSLALRRGPDHALETVPPTVIPALHPERGPGGVVTSSPGPAATASSVVQHPSPAGSIGATARVPGAVQRPAMAESPSRPDRIAPVAGALAAPVAVPVAAVDVQRPHRVATASPEADLAQAGPAAPRSSPQPSEPAAPEQADQIRQRFDRLTDGLLDRLLPGPPPDMQRDGR